MIIPSQLRSARESLRLDLHEAAMAMHLDEDILRAWETGAAMPTIEQVWQLADFYSRDVDYFLTEAPAVPLNLSFRLVGRRGLEQLPIETRKVVARFDELCRAQMELEESLGEVREIKIARVADKIAPEELAKRVREDLGKQDRPIKDVRRLLEAQGIRIFALDIPENTFSGLSWWHSLFGPCVLVNYNDVPGRRNFTLSHEYCHLLLGHGPAACEIEFDYIRATDRATDEERLASRFAAEFLMPADDVKAEFWRRQLEISTVSDRELVNLAARYGASLEAIGRRLEELGLAHKGFVDERIAKWKAARPVYRRGHRKRPKWEKQLGSRFVSTALRAYSGGRISLGALSHYLGVDMREAYRHVHREEPAPHTTW